jgi:uncharacterized protein
VESWYLYVVVGVACGIFSAAFGVGAGIVLIPVLVLAFSFPQKSAQGVCLAAMVPMALVGAIRYKLNPDIEVNMLVVGLLSAGAVVGALIGSSIAAWASGPVLRKLFAVIMIVAAIRMLTTSGARKPAPDPPATTQAHATTES